MDVISPTMAITLLSGLALFLYGMTTMSNGLEAAASSKLKRIIELFTANPIIAILVGAFVTAIFQSSSATTVMVVGFVNAGIMSLTQALGIIMGANIGTTITAQMVSFHLDAVAPYAIVIGVAGMFFNENNILRKYAQIFLGFGILFMGMNQMSTTMKVLRDIPQVRDVITSLSHASAWNTFLLLLIGLTFTGIIQSSSATTALLVSMVGEGAISVDVAFPIIMGANIGTTVTALLSCIGTNRSAIKAAMIHFLFNFIGVFIFVSLFMIFREHAIQLIHNLGVNPTRQIANTHTIFNVANTIILFPFSKLLIKIVNSILPEDDNRQDTEQHLDARMLETPSLALQAVKNEIARMGEKSVEAYKNAIDAFLYSDSSKVDYGMEIEEVINSMEKYIADFLIKLSNSPLSPIEHKFVDNMFAVINDLERIGDHSKNIVQIAELKIKNNLVFSDNAMKDFINMHEKVLISAENSIQAYLHDDVSNSKKVLEAEKVVNELEKEYRKSHIKRLNDGTCHIESGVLFLDLLSGLERISDYSKNLAYYVLDENSASIKKADVNHK